MSKLGGLLLKCFLLSSDLDLSEYRQTEAHHLRTSAQSKLSIASVRTGSKVARTCNCMPYEYTGWCDGNKRLCFVIVQADVSA